MSLNLKGLTFKLQTSVMRISIIIGCRPALFYRDVLILINLEPDLINEITVVVFSKNHEKFIAECLNSIHRELPDSKIVCIDTSLTDQCHEISKSIAKDLNLNSMHIKLDVDTKTLSALKIIENHISTKNIIILSADDAFGQNYRGALINSLKKNREGTVFNFTSVITDQNLKPIYSRKPQWSEQSIKNRRKLSYSNPGTAPGAVIPWTKLVSSPTWINPPEIIIEDYWIWWQLVDLVPFVNCTESSVLYRQHQDNISKASKNKDYAYSLGYVTAIPNIKANSIFYKLISVTLIFRWIRHLNITVWHKFIKGYFAAKRNVKSL